MSRNTREASFHMRVSHVFKLSQGRVVFTGSTTTPSDLIYKRRCKVVAGGDSIAVVTVYEELPYPNPPRPFIAVGTPDAVDVEFLRNREDVELVSVDEPDSPTV